MTSKIKKFWMKFTYSTVDKPRSKILLELIHFDVCGPNTTEGFTTFIDDSVI